MGCSPAWGFGEGLTTPHCKKKKKKFLRSIDTGPRIWTDSSERPRPRKMGMRFGTWNVRRLCRAGSLKAVTSELSECNIDLVVVQEVRWEKGGS
jgi:hypothetical protein